MSASASRPRRTVQAVVAWTSPASSPTVGRTAARPRSPRPGQQGRGDRRREPRHRLAHPAGRPARQGDQPDRQRRLLQPGAAADRRDERRRPRAIISRAACATNASWYVSRPARPRPGPERQGRQARDRRHAHATPGGSRAWLGPSLTPRPLLRARSAGDSNPNPDPWPRQMPDSPSADGRSRIRRMREPFTLLYAHQARTSAPRRGLDARSRCRFVGPATGRDDGSRRPRAGSAHGPEAGTRGDACASRISRGIASRRRRRALGRAATVERAAGENLSITRRRPAHRRRGCPRPRSGPDRRGHRGGGACRAARRGYRRVFPR